MTGRRGTPLRIGDAPLALGITDLMTSLAVVFVLLVVVFAHAPAPARDTASAPLMSGPSEAERMRAALEQISLPGVRLESDARDALVLRVIIPESLLHFEFGKSALTPAAQRFLADALPRYARALCGEHRARVSGVVIEGHTDDLGGDAVNLRLSQERSFRVLVRGLEAVRASAPDAHGCLAALASASGRGKQDLVYDAAGGPDRDSSRRVVMKILLRAGAAR